VEFVEGLRNGKEKRWLAAGEEQRKPMGDSIKSPIARSLEQNIKSNYLPPLGSAVLQLGSIPRGFTSHG
jgi:hypothetical protein